MAAQANARGGSSHDARVLECINDISNAIMDTPGSFPIPGTTEVVTHLRYNCGFVVENQRFLLDLEKEPGSLRLKDLHVRSVPERAPSSPAASPQPPVVDEDEASFGGGESVGPAVGSNTSPDGDSTASSSSVGGVASVNNTRL